MPRILIDARAVADSHCGGINRVARLWILDQTKNFQSQDCTCVTTGLKASTEVKRFCDENNFNYLHIKVPNKLWTLFCHLNLFSLILSAEKKLKNPIDLFLLPNIAYTGAIYRHYHILVHDLSFLIEPRWFNFRRRLWHKYVKADRRIKNADQIHYVSNQTKSDVIKLLDALDTKCHTFLFDPKIEVRSSMLVVRPAWLPPTATRIALMLGGSDPRKNIKTALKAIAEFNVKNPQNYLTPVILGGKVKFNFGEHNISYVEAPGFISDEELSWLYQNSSVLLYPSWYEGFGLPLHEAHHFNKPIIASTGGALSETAPPNTILCNPAKVSEWISAIQISQLNLN
ncbi:MAG: glycosyltransferase [Patescibacteria group bacterium]|nr:glycosyltransferase [Patescibacteria group bacterium]